MASNDAVTVGQLLASQGRLDEDVIAARVDGRVLDLHTEVPEGAEQVEPIRLGDPEALPIVRHSSAHVMADAVQRLYPGTKVAFGPATDTGFYYDLDPPSGAFGEEDLRRIEREMERIIAQDHPFERRRVGREEARRLMEEKGEPYKLEHLERLQEPIYVYRHGDWVDLCEGPHVPSTRYLKAFRLTSVSGAYWRGDERGPMLQRIYGTAFGSDEDLKAYLERLEEARKRDHRKLGRELELFTFHPLAPASPFFLPRGARVYNALVDYVRALYERHGYQEVVTPQVFDRSLFHTSGHLPAFEDGMFLALGGEELGAVAEAVRGSEGESEALERLREGLRYGVKPMNCPGHCLLYGTRRRSYRELPLRIADFGRLHRYERSGVVQGLTRVRSMAQDDAHIFCTEEQLQEEIARFIDFVEAVYADFGFEQPRLVVATRPEEKLGDDALWDRAEAALIEAVRSRGLDYDVAEGEGAHYGPKIEFHLHDALGRPWQLGTIQLDFNLPERFDLSYVGADNKPHRPVMLHRAALGSIERFYGVLLEHCGGAFPTWLAPEQIVLVTVSRKFDDYAKEAVDVLRRAGIRAELDASSDKLGAKIRRWRTMRVPYIGVVGGREAEARALGLRARDENADLGMIPLDEIVERIGREGVPPSRRTE